MMSTAKNRARHFVSIATMFLIDRLAEARILEAMQRGEFDDLPGTGKPLRLEDDRLVPEELRTAYRILKNAGYIPPELEMRRQISELAQLLGTVDDLEVKKDTRKRMQLLGLRLSLARGYEVDFRTETAYYHKLCERVGGCTSARSLE
jgi:hypothetical protein